MLSSKKYTLLHHVNLTGVMKQNNLKKEEDCEIENTTYSNNGLTDIQELI